MSRTRSSVPQLCLATLDGTPAFAARPHALLQPDELFLLAVFRAAPPKLREQLSLAAKLLAGSEQP